MMHPRIRITLTLLPATTLLLVFYAHILLAYGEDPSEALYNDKCAKCHATNGDGNTKMGKKKGCRDLRSAEVQRQSDKELYAIIADGKEDMPAYGKKLEADQISGLVSYIRKLAK